MIDDPSPRSAAATRRAERLPETGCRRSSGCWSSSACWRRLPLLYASVQSTPIYAAGRAFTLSAYRQLFSDPAFWAAARNTPEFAGSPPSARSVLGAAFAVVCAPDRRPRPPRRYTPCSRPAAAAAARRHPRLERAVRPRRLRALSSSPRTLHIPLNLTSVPGMAVLGTATGMPVVVPDLPGGAGQPRRLAGERGPQRRRRRRCGSSAASRCRCCGRRCSTPRCWSSPCRSSHWGSRSSSAHRRPRLRRQLPLRHLVQRVHARPAVGQRRSHRSCWLSPSPCCCCAAALLGSEARFVVRQRPRPRGGTAVELGRLPGAWSSARSSALYFAGDDLRADPRPRAAVERLRSSPRWSPPGTC